jgi:hypothetical protein
VRALLEQLGVVVRRGAVDHHDRPVRLVHLGELVQQRLGLQLAHLGVVVRVVVIDARPEELAVVRDDRDVLRVGPGHDRLGRGGVDRVEHQDLGAVGDGGLGLLLLLRRVLVGVRVDHLAIRAELLDLRLEQGPVLGLVPGVLRLRQQERDRPPAAAGARGVRGAALVVVVTTCGQAQRQNARGDDRGDGAPLAPYSHVRPFRRAAMTALIRMRAAPPPDGRRLCNDRHDVTTLQRARGRRR